MTEDATTLKTANIKTKRYELRLDIQQRAERVIQERGIVIRPARVKFFAVFPHINKTTAARCMIASNLVNFLGDVDYAIEVSGDLWEALPEELRCTLLWHELLHIYPIQNEKTGEYKFTLREHDINEFKEIIREYGVDWLDDIKKSFIESGGFEPEEIDTLGI